MCGHGRMGRKTSRERRRSARTNFQICPTRPRTSVSAPWDGFPNLSPLRAQPKTAVDRDENQRHGSVAARPGQIFKLVPRGRGPLCPPAAYPTAKHRPKGGQTRRSVGLRPACLSNQLPPTSFLSKARITLLRSTSPATQAPPGRMNEKRRTAPYSKFSVAGARTSVSARWVFIGRTPLRGATSGVAGRAIVCRLLVWIEIHTTP
jgi:hypothetical protein